MLIMHVFVHVKSDSVDRFITATLENARNSVREPGVVRFDLVQEDDPTRFSAHRDLPDSGGPIAPQGDRALRDLARRREPMMAEPRRSVKYRALFPEAAAWERPG